jgi:deoxyhypusine synthase
MFKYTGFQATNLALAIEEVNKMVCTIFNTTLSFQITWRLSDEPITEDESEDYKDEEVRRNIKCKIFLGYTSNMISAGVREFIRYLVEHKMVDVIVTTAGGIEEDFIKCMADTYLGAFDLKGEMLRKKGINRTGNLLVPNDNYCKFEDWIMPLLDKMLEEQKTQGTLWTPSKIINRLGKEINHKDSVYYWAYKNDIPVFCPALTDGSLGDMIYFHSFANPGLVVDIASDIRAINSQAVYAKRTGMIILGGGVVKHHICNANLMRNGADHTVLINTGQEFDGSDSGARPDEAVSWGKIKLTGSSIKVYADASLVFPIIVAQTFVKHFEQNKSKQ